jgi:hypothetical protein
MEKGLAGIDKTWSPSRIAYNKFVTKGDPANRGYARVDKSTYPVARAELLTQITGQPARVIQTSTAQETAATWKQLLDEGNPVLVVSAEKRADPSAFNIVSGQVYEVIKVEDGNVIMRNLWGRLHPDPVPVTELGKHIYSTTVTLDSPHEGGQG